jgi:hypothetical protein
MTVFEGYITQDIDSAEVFRRIDNFCRFFALEGLLEFQAFENSVGRPTHSREDWS